MSKQANAERIAKWRTENPERSREIGRKANKTLYDKRQEEKYLARLRDEFAMAALTSLVNDYSSDIAASESYRFADAMLEARK